MEKYPFTQFVPPVLREGDNALRFLLDSGVRIDHVIRSHSGSSPAIVSVRCDETAGRDRRGQMILRLLASHGVVRRRRHLEVVGIIATFRLVSHETAIC